MINNNKLLGITIASQSKSIILYKIKKYLEQPVGFFHIVSLNPENLVIAQENLEFKKVLETAQIKLIDGVGIILAARLLRIEAGERVTGVELMEELIKLAGERRLRVLLIGGKDNLAERLANCYQKRFPEAKFLGLEGIKEIKNPQKKEEEKIFSIVADFKPHFVFAAFGSPDQELWLARHYHRLAGVVGMGVGGAFDFLSGRVPRAPSIIRRLGFEWLFRLLVQPWRWRRQRRLVKFAWLIFLELFSIFVNKMWFFP